MQPHERVRIEPVAAGPVPAIDEGDLHARMAGHGVGESHAGRPGPDYQVVSLERVWHSSHSTRGTCAGVQPLAVSGDTSECCENEWLDRGHLLRDVR